MRFPGSVGTGVLIVAAVSLFGAGCNFAPKQGDKLDHTKTEASIKKSLVRQGFTPARIECPSRIRKQDDAFACTGYDDEDGRFKVSVTQTDDEGTVTWKVQGVFVSKREVGDEIEGLISPTANIKCPDKTVILREGEWFMCDIEGSDFKKVLITLKDEKKHSCAWSLKEPFGIGERRSSSLNL